MMSDTEKKRMSQDEYFALYTSMSGDLPGIEAWRLVEKHHMRIYGSHKCTTYASFKALRSRYYREKRNKMSW